MSDYVDIDTTEFKEFFSRMEKAAQGDFRTELETFLEGLGEEFLRLVQDEFVNRHKNTGYGNLVASFRRNADKNIWEYEDDGLSIVVGSSVEYASWVNDGHRTFDPSSTRHFTLGSGEAARFVPGYWQGQRFIYDPGATGGMVLKYHWVTGLKFWEAAIHAMEKMCPEFLNAKLQQWIDQYFG